MTLEGFVVQRQDTELNVTMPMRKADNAGHRKDAKRPRIVRQQGGGDGEGDGGEGDEFGEDWDYGLSDFDSDVEETAGGRATDATAKDGEKRRKKRSAAGSGNEKKGLEDDEEDEAAAEGDEEEKWEAVPESFESDEARLRWEWQIVSWLMLRIQAPAFGHQARWSQDQYVAFVRSLRRLLKHSIPKSTLFTEVQLRNQLLSSLQITVGVLYCAAADAGCSVAFIDVLRWCSTGVVPYANLLAYRRLPPAFVQASRLFKVAPLVPYGQHSWMAARALLLALRPVDRKFWKNVLDARQYARSWWPNPKDNTQEGEEAQEEAQEEAHEEADETQTRLQQLLLDTAKAIVFSMDAPIPLAIRYYPPECCLYVLARMLKVKLADNVTFSWNSQGILNLTHEEQVVSYVHGFARYAMPADVQVAFEEIVSTVTDARSSGDGHLQPPIDSKHKLRYAIPKVWWFSSELRGSLAANDRAMRELANRISKYHVQWLSSEHHDAARE
jgi:hypothetical protein